jgi:hypothetical protein
MATLSLARVRLLAVIILAAALMLAALPLAGRAIASSSPLFISEYVSGSGNNRALEIYNSGPALNLAALSHSIEIYFDGSPVAGAVIPLSSGFIAEGDVWVIAHPDADQAILDVANQIFSGPWFDGNDTVLLVTNGTPVDRFGQYTFDPGTAWGDGDTSTADNTLRRQETVSTGDPGFQTPFDPSTEWVGVGLDVFDGLGCWGESACTTGEPPDGDGTPFAALRELVETYRDEGELDTDAAEALLDHVDRAADGLADGNNAAARGHLRALIGRLRGFESRGLVGTEEAAALAAASQELIDSL